MSQLAMIQLRLIHMHNLDECKNDQDLNSYFYLYLIYPLYENHVLDHILLQMLDHIRCHNEYHNFLSILFLSAY